MKAPATMTGKKGKCPHCQTAFIVGGGPLPAPTQPAFGDLQPLGDGDLQPLGSGDLQPLPGSMAAHAGGLAPLGGGSDLFASLPSAPQLAPAPLPTAPSPLGYTPSPSPFAGGYAAPSANPYAAPNPYAASGYAGAPVQYGRPTVAPAKLMVPAILLLLISVVTIGGFMISGVFRLMDPAPPIVGNGDPQASIMAYRIGTVIGMLAGLIVNVCVIAGAVQMIRLKGYETAKGGAMAAIVPCCSVLCLNMPFGIWALVVLNQPDVKRMFS